MKKVNTKRYGMKNLLEQRRVPSTYDLYLGEISVTQWGCRSRRLGLIDTELDEIIPFGELYRDHKIRVVNDHIIIVDQISIPGTYGISHDLYGSILCMKEKGKYKVVYNSDAAIMLVTNEMILGANFEGEVCDDDKIFPTTTYEYNYQTGELNRQTFAQNAFVDGDLQEYLLKKYLPYSPEKHELKRVLRKKAFEKQ